MENKKSKILDLDIPSLEAPEPRLKLVSKPVIVTDWNWMLDQAARGGGEDVQAKLKRWDEGRRRLHGNRVWDKIVTAMRQFEHRHLYTLKEADIGDVMARTHSSFGGVTGDDSEKGGIDKATSPAPYVLMLHNLLETKGTIPTWQDFQEYHWKNPGVYLRFIADFVRLPVGMFIDSDWLTHPVARAIRYRLGSAYNSFIRELHLMCVLRERYGILLTHHFLLDALWKIDFLHNNTALEVFLENPRWKVKNPEAAERERAKKTLCHKTNPARDVLMVTFAKRSDSKSYDFPWLFTDAEIAEVARRLLAGEVDYRGLPRF
jgi:hypothetical protein|nr:hypothetical protein [Neorhizobium tomejilense]